MSEKNEEHQPRTNDTLHQIHFYFERFEHKLFSFQLESFKLFIKKAHRVIARSKKQHFTVNHSKLEWPYNMNFIYHEYYDAQQVLSHMLIKKLFFKHCLIRAASNQ